jgi:hypothetical protein
MLVVFLKFLHYAGLQNQSIAIPGQQLAHHNNNSYLEGTYIIRNSVKN